MAAATRNPKDNMTSTWRSWDRSKWTFGHWLLEVLNVHHTDKVPYANEFQFHRWVLIHTFIHSSSTKPTSTTSATHQYGWSSFSTALALEFIAVHETHVLRRMGHTIGFFDGDKHPRDGVPDVGVGKTAQSLLCVIAVRPMILSFLTYRADEGPLSIKWGWLIFETGMYPLVLDFWYYTFHRSAHEIEHLWKFHRTHHLTKHPNPLLTAYADEVQEFVDIVGTPLITYGTLKLMGFPMGFYEWWICQQYVVFTEVLGHSGLRMIATAANPWNWLLKLCDMELVIEDHDLHHRKGWKNSHNYGKQTRVWDRLFNTSIPRIEGHAGNIDYVNTAKIPFF
ncbi:hypothetical protein N7454_007043 [Penicillium verhagenii]|nr:hypothetical protein N7454_007043 [Penicillium verhagenii]